MIELAKLTIGKQLGGGGQGKVFFATEPSGKHLAVKILAAKPGLDPSQRLTALGADQLVGPLVPVLAQASLDVLPPELLAQLGTLPREGRLLVMPFVPGVSLARMRAEGPLRPVEVAAALGAVAAKLARLPKGVAHGDLRAANVLVQPDGDVALIDPDLWRQPPPEEDPRALGALARELLEQPPPGALAMLLADLDRPQPPSVAEAAARFADIAQTGGARKGDIGVVLVPRVKPLMKGVEAIVAAGGGRTVAKGRSHWGWRIARWVVAAPFLLVLLLSSLNWFFEHITTETVVSQNRTLSGAVSEPGRYIQANPGVVSYAEQLHELKPGQMAAAEDGFIQAKVIDSVPRIAILSARDALLWEERQPEPGEVHYFDVKEGVYSVEIDRASGQIDKEPAVVDVNHPFRLLVTALAYHAPTRNSDWGFHRMWSTFKMLLRIR